MDFQRSDLSDTQYFFVLASTPDDPRLITLAENHISVEKVIELQKIAVAAFLGVNADAKRAKDIYVNVRFNGTYVIWEKEPNSKKPGHKQVRSSTSKVVSLEDYRQRKAVS